MENFKNLRTAALWGHYELSYRNGKVFESNDNTLGQNLNSPFVSLRHTLKTKNISLTTLDLVDAKDVTFFISIDAPNLKNKKIRSILHHAKKKILVLLETPMILPENYKNKLHENFDIIFTWDDNLIDNTKFFKSDFPNYFDKTLPYFNIKNRKLLCLIANNKMISSENNLYTKRLKFINECAQLIKDDFGLYGRDWDKYLVQNRYVNFILNKLNLNKYIPFKARKISNGVVDNKLSVLSNYKFSLCLENASGYSGYVTEKIFDCFFSGTIPIYAGAENIKDIIPENCFINYYHFKDNYHLVYYIKNLTNSKIKQIRHNILKYLQSDKFIQNHTDISWANRISKEL